MISAKEVACPTCSSETAAMRISRSGFWQRTVMGYLRIYPWKCGACGVVFWCRRRGYRGLPAREAGGDRRSRRAA
jgi:hypothetical protein